jgi:TonB family protein
MRTKLLVFGLWMGTGLSMLAQTPASVVPQDAALDVAADYVGRALFLRCFCAENNLSFDSQGKPTGTVKPEDWTLAAVNVLKVGRKGPGLVEMDGVRVAIKFVPERREFERHVQNDEKMHITVADTGDPKQMERALEAVFAVGIDLPLQRAMPDYWRHYFDPKLAWPTDELSGNTIYSTSATSTVTPPSVTHRVDASYTTFAMHDRVRGTVQLRMIVDAQGAARHVAIALPLGYGLDKEAVEAARKFRFAPAANGGSAVDSGVLLDEGFAPVVVPR